MRTDLDEQLSDWLFLDGGWVEEAERDALLDHQGLSRAFGAIAGFAPPALAELMAYSTVQLAAGLEGQAPRAQDLVASVLAAVLAWIEEAFDGVPPPGPENRTLRQAEGADNYEDVARRPGESEGPWQTVCDAYLLESQWALPHLDAVGLRYYLPAVMSFALRHLREGHPDDGWLTESLTFTLYPAKPHLRSYQEQRMGGLTEEERKAIAGFCWITENEASLKWAGSIGAGGDWITAFHSA